MLVSPYIPPVVDGWVWMQVHPCSQLDKLLKQMAVAAKVVQHKGFPTVQDEIQSSKGCTCMEIVLLSKPFVAEMSFGGRQRVRPGFDILEP